jgi:hypothetical protein
MAVSVLLEGKRLVHRFSKAYEIKKILSPAEAKYKNQRRVPREIR